MENLMNEETQCFQEESSGNIYRYKFCEEFVDLLSDFAKVHQFDERKDFKEAFTNWVEENKEIISFENERLKDLGYSGDMCDKMFRSARYYFRTKETTKPLIAPRKKYTQLSLSFLELMKHHLDNNKALKPAVSYDLFCETYRREFIEETRLIETNGECAESKIKKAFKNKYFNVKNSK
jgi:hypothetical protein